MEEDIFMRLMTLAIPLLFIFGGIFTFITAIRGRLDRGEHPRKASMSEEAFKKFRKNEILIGTVFSLGMITFGGWLLYCWMFGPIER